MAKEFVRFWSPGPEGGSDLIPVEYPKTIATGEPASAAGQGPAALRPPSFQTRQQLRAQHGEALGDALWQVQQEPLRAAVGAYQQDLARLKDINSQVAAIDADVQLRREAAQRAVDEAYKQYLAACGSLDGISQEASSRKATLLGEAETILRRIHCPENVKRMEPLQWREVTDTQQRSE